MSAALPDHDVVAVLRPGRTVLLRNRATERLVVAKRLPARAEKRLGALGPLACGWGIVTRGGVPHLVRPYVTGRPLAELLRDGPLSEARAVPIARALAGALAPLHARGIAHGELHPGNVILSDDGAVTILDGLEPFCGVAEPGDPYAAAEAAHAAPEVVRGARPTPRADVWTIGLLVHRLLTGAHPLEGGDPATTAARILYETPLGTGLARPDLPPTLAAAVDRALSRSPRARFRSAAAFAAALGGPALEPRPALAGETPRRALARGNALRVAAAAPRLALFAAPVIAIALLWLGGDDPLAREVGELLEARDVSRAAEVLDRAAAQRPGDPRVEKLRGDLACARGRSGECLRRYRAALEAKPALAEDPVLRENVLALLAREDDRALAVRLATRIEGVDGVLLERTRSDRYWTRWNAVRALEARGQAERIDYAEVYASDLLHGGSCATRRAAAAKLAELRDPRTLPALEQARKDAGPFGWFCTGDTIGRAIAAVRSRDGT